MKGWEQMKFIKQIDLQTIFLIISLFVMNRVGIIKFQFFVMMSIIMLFTRMVGGVLSDNKKDYEHIGFMNVKNVRIWSIYVIAVAVIGVLGYNFKF